MKYNITDLDVCLANDMNTEEGRKIKVDLSQKIAEEELMLDQFEISLTHCKEQIELYNLRIQNYNKEIVNCKNHINPDINAKTILFRAEKEKLKHQKLVFEENMLIWKISGYITLISIDVKTMQKGLYSSQSEWDKRFYARQAYVIMYDAPNRISTLLENLSKLKGVNVFKSRLQCFINLLKEFNVQNYKYINEVRSNTVGHKDENVLKQIDIIKNINWSNTIELTMKFEYVINDLGKLMKDLIDNGLENLRISVPIK